MVRRLLILCALPAIARAHGGHGGGVLDGLLHPVHGLDHLLAMLSVGILSAQMGGRALWSVPLAFVVVMLIGGILGMCGVPMVSVELGIVSSVFALGIALAAERKMPTALAMLVVAVFAVFHGHAHGAEMPELGHPVGYALGFCLGTIAIHVAGVLVGVVFNESPRGAHLLRYAGAGIAGVGFHMVLGVFEAA